MSQRRSDGQANSYWGKLGLAAGAGACVLPIPLFGVKLPSLPMAEQCVLTGVFVAALAVCSLTASRWPLVGLLALPPCFFGLMCLACWWTVSP
jgi:hypothetical protein